MSERVETTSTSGWKNWLLDRVAELRQREEQVFLVLALVIGALTGLAVVAFIVLTERLGMRLYPVGGAPWRRVLSRWWARSASVTCCIAIFPTPEAAACPRPRPLFRARRPHHAAHRAWQVLLHFGNAGQRIPLGREGPSVQVGGGIASVLGRLVGLRTEQVKNLIPRGRRRRSRPRLIRLWPRCCSRSRRSWAISTRR